MGYKGHGHNSWPNELINFLESYAIGWYLRITLLPIYGRKHNFRTCDILWIYYKMEKKKGLFLFLAQLNSSDIYNKLIKKLAW